jgi:opacity protein-like surface antigen
MAHLSGHHTTNCGGSSSSGGSSGSVPAAVAAAAVAAAAVAAAAVAAAAVAAQRQWRCRHSGLWQQYQWRQQREHRSDVTCIPVDPAPGRGTHFGLWVRWGWPGEVGRGGDRRPRRSKSKWVLGISEPRRSPRTALYGVDSGCLKDMKIMKGGSCGLDPHFLSLSLSLSHSLSLSLSHTHRHCKHGAQARRKALGVMYTARHGRRHGRRVAVRSGCTLHLVHGRGASFGSRHEIDPPKHTPHFSAACRLQYFIQPASQFHQLAARLTARLAPL